MYNYKVLKQVHLSAGIPSKTRIIMNLFVSKAFEQLAGEATRLDQSAGQRMLTSRGVQTVICPLLSREPCRHSVPQEPRW